MPRGIAFLLSARLKPGMPVGFSAHTRPEVERSELNYSACFTPELVRKHIPTQSAASGSNVPCRISAYLCFVLFLISLVTISGCGTPGSPVVDQWDLLETRTKNAAKETRPALTSPRVRGRTDPDRRPPQILHPVTLVEAIAYAIDHNLDAAVMQLEEEIRLEALTGARLKMLPALTLTGEYGRRNDVAASFSDALHGTEGFQNYNFSRDKANETANLELSWDILDFGIAYYKSRQAYGRVAIAEQQTRRVIQNLRLDITEAYWNAQVAMEAMEAAGELVDRLKTRQQILRTQAESQAVSKIDVLETAAALSEMKLRIDSYEREYRRYKLQLATLMGIPIPASFEIAKFDFHQSPTRVQLDVKALETMALRQRPELFEQDLQESISAKEAKIALLEMAPSTTAFWEFSYDADSHLYKNEWNTAGLRLSLDLLAAPHKLSLRRQARLQARLARDRRLALAAAILAQLNITAVNYEDAIRKYLQHVEISGNREQLMLTHRAHEELGKSNAQTVLENELKYLVARERALTAFGDVMITEERILNTIGHDDPSVRPLTMLSRELMQPPPEEAPPLRAEAPPKAPEAVTPVTPVIIDRIEEERPPGPPPTEEIQEPPGPPVPDLPPHPPPGPPAIVDERPVTEPAYLPYSLQLSSWPIVGQARERVAMHRREGLKAYHVRVDLGAKGVWWRVFSGCYRTLEEAVEAKTTWNTPDAIVWKTPHAVLLETLPGRHEMQAAIGRLEARGFSPYWATGEDGVFRIYSGAYLTQEAAQAHRDDLDAQGLEAEAVLRQTRKLLSTPPEAAPPVVEEAPLTEAAPDAEDRIEEDRAPEPLAVEDWEEAPAPLPSQPPPEPIELPVAEDMQPQTEPVYLPYSLQLSSWPTVEKASERVAMHRRTGLKAYHVRVDLGAEGVLWRVFAGCYATMEDARRAQGTEDQPDAVVWDTPYAALVETCESEQEMQAVIGTLEARGFSPYAVMGEDGVYRIYSGAYMNQKAAETHQDDLAARGIVAKAVLRHSRRPVQPLPLEEETAPVAWAPETEERIDEDRPPEPLPAQEREEPPQPPIEPPEIAEIEDIQPETEPAYFPYSLQLSSWPTVEEARERVARHRRAGTKAYHVRVDLGAKGVWWRVFTGYYATIEDAREATETENHPDAIVWKTPYAVLVETSESEREMQTAIGRLEARGFCPYSVIGEDGVYRIYSGAYVTREVAEAHRDALTTRGTAAEVALRQSRKLVSPRLVFPAEEDMGPAAEAPETEEHIEEEELPVPPGPEHTAEHPEKQIVQESPGLPGFEDTQLVAEPTTEAAFLERELIAEDGPYEFLPVEDEEEPPAPLPPEPPIDPSPESQEMPGPARFEDEHPKTEPAYLPYSLQMSSWRRVEEARERVAMHRRAGLDAYYVRVNLGAKGTWWRVFTGCYATSEDGLEARETAGRPNAVVWKTPYAVLVETCEDEQEMQAVSGRLEARGFSPYSVMGEDGVYRVYSGAYVTPAAAEAHREDLSARGIWANVVLR